MELIITILGSTVIGGIITAGFNWIQNRKHNSLSYITEERKLWREKIRNISEGIQISVFNGNEEENIMPYLVQLEMNINTYGKLSKYDYIHDGHIWDTIQKIEDSDNINDFEINKKLLLCYISLMLKNDWERSKKEIKGYSDKLLLVFIYIMFMVLIYIYCFVILKLKVNILFVILLFINLLPIYLIKYIDEIGKYLHESEIFSMSIIVKNRKKIIPKIMKLVGIIAVYYILLFFCLDILLPDLMMKNISCSYNNNSLIINLELDSNFFYEINEKIKSSILLDRYSFDEDFENRNISILSNEDYLKLKEIIKKQTEIYSLFIYTLAGLWGLVIIYFESFSTVKSEEFISGAKNIKYLICNEYECDFLYAKQNLYYIISMNNDYLYSEECDGLIGIEYMLLTKLKIEVQKKLNVIQSDMKSYVDYQRKVDCAKSRDVLAVSIVQLEKFQKQEEASVKKDIIKNIVENLENVDQ